MYAYQSKTAKATRTPRTQQESRWSVKPILHTFNSKLTFLQAPFEFQWAKGI